MVFEFFKYINIRKKFFKFFFKISSITCNNSCNEETSSTNTTPTTTTTTRTDSNESKSSGLGAAEFDLQTFPLLNLLFSNNKITLSSSQQQSCAKRADVNNSITKIRVNLESRKRSFLPNQFGGGIPNLICNKIHTNNFNTRG